MANMTHKEFGLYVVRAERLAAERGYRRGQAYYNELPAAIASDVTDKFPDHDPFYKDERIPTFLQLVLLNYVR